MNCTLVVFIFCVFMPLFYSNTCFHFASNFPPIELKWRWEMNKTKTMLLNRLSFLFKRYLKNFARQKTRSNVMEYIDWNELKRLFTCWCAFNWHITLESIITMNVHWYDFYNVTNHQFTMRIVAGDFCNFQWALFLLFHFNFLISK